MQGARTGSVVGQHEWPLVGRDDELTLAIGALAENRCVVLSGAAGVGKTRLAREVIARCTRPGQRIDWVAATHAAASVPLGPLAHLVPRARLRRGRDETLAAIVAALDATETNGGLLLGVDDAHLLDSASALVVQILVTRRFASAVLTVRSGEAVPDAISSLWKDHGAPLVALQPLAREEVDALVTSALGGDVDGATLHLLFESTRGNALFLRELVRHGMESSKLREEFGLWRWYGEMGPDERLHDLVATRMGTLTSDELDTLELVAMGEPLPLRCLAWLGVVDQAARLERRGLLTSLKRNVREVSLVHPLFAEVLRARMPPIRRDAVQLALADAVEATGDGSDSERFRVTLWRFAADDRTRVDQLRAAAGRAALLWDERLSEQLARAAFEAEPDAESAYVLGEALSDQHRSLEALDMFATAVRLAGSADLRATAAVARAGVLAGQLQQHAVAEALLLESAAGVRDPVALRILDGGIALIRMAGGTSTLGDPGAGTIDTTEAALAAVIEHGFAGRLDLALAIARDALKNGPQGSVFPNMPLYLHNARSVMMMLRGDLARAQTYAEAAYAAAVAMRSDFPRAIWCVIRGMLFVTRGQPRSATRALREGLAFFADVDRGFLRPAHAYLAMAAALSGDITAADHHSGAAQRAHPSLDFAFGIDVERAYAWARAARGEISSAIEASEEAALLAHDRGQLALEAIALHDIVRFGGATAVERRLTQIAVGIDGELIPAMAQHAHGAVAGSGTALDGAAHEFGRLGFDLFAAEVGAAAARAHRAAGNRGANARARELVREHATRCEEATTSLVQLTGDIGELTPREREVALLAATEIPSREIAQRLGITTRTVDNLLGRAYAKLAVAGRQELREVLGGGELFA